MARRSCSSARSSRSPASAKKAGTEPGWPDHDQAAIEHALHCRGDLRLTLLLSRAPDAQEDAVGDAAILVEVTA
jgi:hypothetical protein